MPIAERDVVHRQRQRGVHDGELDPLDGRITGGHGALAGSEPGRAAPPAAPRAARQVDRRGQPTTPATSASSSRPQRPRRSGRRPCRVGWWRAGPRPAGCRAQSGPAPSAEVPDLRAAVATARDWLGRWTAVAAGPADAVLGCSGAAVTLPAVAAAAGACRVFWVDALVPARSGVTVADDHIRALVAERTGNGRIADWTTWLGADALDDLIPDEDLRAVVRPDEGLELLSRCPLRGPRTAPGTSSCRRPTTTRRRKPGSAAGRSSGTDRAPTPTPPGPRPHRRPALLEVAVRPGSR